MTASTKRAKPPTMMRQGKPIKAFSPFSRGLGRRPAALLSAILMLTAGGLERVSGQTVIRASAYGARPNDGADDTAALRAALEACREQGPVRLELSRGRYDFIAERPSTTLHVHGLDNLTIDGRGATLVFHGPQSPIVAERCRRLRVGHFTIDWERPPFSVGRIVAAQGRSFDVAVLPEFPVSGGEPVAAFMDYDPATRLPRRHGIDAYDQVTSTVLLRTQVLRVALRNELPLDVGSLAVLRHFTYGHAALLLSSCDDARVEDVTIHTCPGMGVVGGGCTNVTLERVRVQVKPGTRRLMSTTADATHFKGCRGTIEMRDCVFEGMGDDATNVGGLYLIVRERIDASTVLASHNLRLHGRPDPGDRLEFVRRETLLPYAAATVKAAGEIDNEGACRIAFDSPLPVDLKIGDVLGNTSHTPRVRIARCRVGDNRARGFLLQTYDAIVEDCEFRNCTSGGVWCLNEVVHFHEGVGARDIVIRNNRFENCNYGGPIGEGVISVFSYLAKFQYPPKAGVHRNITIEGNTIRGSDNCGIFITGTDGLKIRNNTIEQTCRMPTRDEGHSAVYIRSSRNAEIAGNHIDPKAQGEGFRRACTLGEDCETSTVRIADP